MTGQTPLISNQNPCNEHCGGGDCAAPDRDRSPRYVTVLLDRFRLESCIASRRVGLEKRPVYSRHGPLPHFTAHATQVQFRDRRKAEVDDRPPGVAPALTWTRTTLTSVPISNARPIAGINKVSSNSGPSGPVAASGDPSFFSKNDRLCNSTIPHSRCRPTP